MDLVQLNDAEECDARLNMLDLSGPHAPTTTAVTNTSVANQADSMSSTGVIMLHKGMTCNPKGMSHVLLAEWRSGSVSALPCERPGFASRTRLREIIPANNCTMQGQNNWGNWGFPGVMKLWVAWEVLRWLMKFRELCSGGFHPKLVTPPYHGFLNVNTPPNSQNSKRH